MATWDSSRPVPWKRLLVEWAVIGTVVAAISLLVTHNRNVGSYLAILFGGGIYVLFGAVLAKFGYARKSLTQMRAETAARPPRTVGRSAAPSTSASGRPKPAPTKRTSTGPSQRPTKKKR